jgi:putative addiction module component (TIGR02574 family)
MAEIDAIIKLSVEERIQAIERIWESINPDRLTVNQAQRDEMSHRLMRYREGKTIFYLAAGTGRVA